MDAPAKEALEKQDIKFIDQLERLVQRKEISDASYKLVQGAHEQYRRLCQWTRNKIHSEVVELEEEPTPASRRIIDNIVSEGCPAITQLYGQKASGKSALLLEMIEVYQRTYPSKQVLLLNCASGITCRRYNRINCNLTYRDVFSLSDILTILEQMEDSQLANVGMLALDQPIKYVKIKQKPETEFSGLVQKLRAICHKRKLLVVFTNNSLTERLRLYNDESNFNEVSQFSASTSPFIDNRVATHRMPDNTHLIVLLKSRFRWDYPKAQQFSVTSNSIKYFDNRLNQ